MDTCNISQRITRQQYGYYEKNTYDVCLPRLMCHKNCDFRTILGADVTEEEEQEHLYAPIFSCKFCTKQGYEHLLGLANEDGKVVIHNTLKTVPRIWNEVHQNAIFDIAWQPGRLALFTAGGDHTVRLVDCATQVTETQLFIGHNRSVKTIAVRETDPYCFATGSRDGSVRIWDTRVSRPGSQGEVVIALSDRIIAGAQCQHKPGGSGGRRGNKPAAVTAAHSVTSVVFKDDYTVISSGSGDGMLKVWDIRRTLVNHAATPVKEIPYGGRMGAVSKHGYSHLMVDRQRNLLYANCLDSTIYCYNTGTFDVEPVMEYKGFHNVSFYIKSDLSPDGRYIISGSSDYDAYIWSTERKYPIVRLSGHSAEVTCVAWRKIGDLAIVTCSDDVKHKIWEVGPENLDFANHEIERRGKAEIIPSRIKTPLKRQRTNENTPQQPKIPRLTPSAKRPSEQDANQNKKRRLFALQEVNENEQLAVILEHPTTPSKVEVEEKGTAKKIEEEYITPKASLIQQHRLDQTPEEVFSPTTNLPNYAIDGCAPHLNRSPLKRVDKDWLTRMRLEREASEDESGPSSSKVRRLEEASPRTPRVTPRRRNSRTSPATTARGQSPIINFFRVTNNSILNNTQCSPRAAILSPGGARTTTAE